MPLVSMPSASTPRKAPKIVPRPPSRLAPPIKAAEIERRARVVAELDCRRVEARSKQDARDGRQRPAQGVGQEQVALDRDAGEIGCLVVAADRVEVAAGACTLEENRESDEDHQGDQTAGTGTIPMLPPPQKMKASSCPKAAAASCR